MILKFLLYNTVSLISLIAFAQKIDSTVVTDVAIVSFLSPGLSYEKPVGKKATFFAEILLSTTAGFSFSSSLGNKAFIQFDPAIAVMYRYYYNHKARLRAAKRTAMNSMNYIAPIVNVVFYKHLILNSGLYEDKRRPVLNAGAVWGLQRNYAKRFSLDLKAGLAYFLAKQYELKPDGRLSEGYESGVGLISGIRLGFWINKRK